MNNHDDDEEDDEKRMRQARAKEEQRRTIMSVTNPLANATTLRVPARTATKLLRRTVTLIIPSAARLSVCAASYILARRRCTLHEITTHDETTVPRRACLLLSTHHLDPQTFNTCTPSSPVASIAASRS